MAREKLTRSEQRYNYAIAVAAVLAVAAVVVVSPQVTVAGQAIPVLPAALLLGAFLFGLGQMVIGLRRRSRWLSSFESGREGITTESLNQKPKE